MLPKERKPAIPQVLRKYSSLKQTIITRNEKIYHKSAANYWCHIWREGSILGNGSTYKHLQISCSGTDISNHQKTIQLLIHLMISYYRCLNFWWKSSQGIYCEHIQISLKLTEITKNNITSDRFGARTLLVPSSGGNLLSPGGGGKRFLTRFP